MENENDRQLVKWIRQIAAGYTKPLDYIYAEYGRKLYAVAYLYSKTDAEDILSDTLVRISEKAETFREDINPVGWLMVVTHNAAKNYISRESRHNHAYIEDMPEWRVDFDDTSVYVNEIYAQCSEEEWDLIIYHIFWGMSFEKIGETLGKPKSTVKYQYDKLVERLRKHFQKN